MGHETFKSMAVEHARANTILDKNKAIFNDKVVNEQAITEGAAQVERAEAEAAAEDQPEAPKEAEKEEEKEGGKFGGRKKGGKRRG